MSTTTERPCFACTHLHNPNSPGPCWEAACLPECPEHEPARIVVGHVILDCREEFDAHEHHEGCERALHGLNDAPSANSVEDPTGCSYVEVCSTCGASKCDRWDEPAPTLEEN